MRQAASNRACALILSSAGLPLACSPAALAQSDPLGVPFTPVFRLSEIDGDIGTGFRGIDQFELSGEVVGSAGDINGDGINDIIIGAQNGSPSGRTRAGVTYVVYGRPASDPFPADFQLSDLDGTNGFRIEGVVEEDNSGNAVAVAGDINGDGFVDLIIGAERADPGGNDTAGSSYVVFGRGPGDPFPATFQLADLDGNNGFRIDGGAASDFSGAAVAAAGDVNGDGIDDVVIGAPGADTPSREDAGASYIVFGRDASAGAFPSTLQVGDLDGMNGFRIDGANAGDLSGRSVAAAGDLNADGIGDLVIGAPGAEPGGRGLAGSVFVVYGRDGSANPFPTALQLFDIDGSNGFRLNGINEFDSTGDAVAAAGDLNGDGIDDLAIGSRYASPGARYAAGSTYIIYGRDTSPTPFPAEIELADLDGSTGFRIDSVIELENSGSSVASAGDINGDNVDDLVIGAEFASPEGRFRAGSSFVLFGLDDDVGSFPPVFELDQLDGTNGFRIDGAVDIDISGSSVAGAGDVNGDGVDDLLVGARNAPPTLRTGITYVIYGRALGDCRVDIDGDGFLTIFDFLEFQNLFGLSDPRADFDGDGVLTIFDFTTFLNEFDAGCS
ncbi:MAG: FG-GAP repeat protein [Phycisphaerales bacterium]|nr:FG-GAP repeat protein [Phycisphaerales bacterium]